MSGAKVAVKPPARLKKALVYLGRNKYLYLLLLPALAFYFIFCYMPMGGILISFQNYMPAFGIGGSEWVGLEHFQRLFRSSDFYRLFRNTVLISFYKLVFYFPMPIILSLMLNEVRHKYFKKTVQTILYFPYFISWVVVYSIVYSLTSLDGGMIPQLFKMLGQEPIILLADKGTFRGLLVVTEIWKNAGWGTIIYLAAIAGISDELYEAARIDGASKWGEIRYITLPCIMPTIVTMLLLSMSNVLNAGFAQVLAMYNPAVYEVADIFDTYVYRQGLLSAQFSYSTAVGLFKSVINFAVVIVFDRIAKRFGYAGLL